MIDLTEAEQTAGWNQPSNSQVGKPSSSSVSRIMPILTLTVLAEVRAGAGFLGKAVGFEPLPYTEIRACSYRFPS